MAEMNPEKLHELAGRVKQMLEEVGIEVDKLTLQVLVPKAYYESIKENFPARHPIDMILGVTEVDWSFNLLYSLYESQEDVGEQG